MIYAATQDRRWTVQAGCAGALGQYQYLEPDAGTTHTATMATDRPHTGFTLYAAAVAGATATVSFDGAAQTWTIASGSTWKSLTVDGLASTNHTVVVTSTNPVLILGADMRYTTTGLNQQRVTERSHRCRLESNRLERAVEWRDSTGRGGPDHCRAGHQR